MQGGKDTAYDGAAPLQGGGVSDMHNPYGGPDLADKAQDNAQPALDKVKDTAHDAQAKAKEVGEKAQQQADVGVDKAAEGMQGAADKLRDAASNQEGVTAQAGTKVADGMEKTAGYLREHDTAQIMDDVEGYVREHPMQALAGALVGGFVIARLIR